MKLFDAINHSKDDHAFIEKKSNLLQFQTQRVEVRADPSKSGFLYKVAFDNYVVWTGHVASSQALQMLLLQNVLSTDDSEWQSVNPLDIPLPS